MSVPIVHGWPLVGFCLTLAIVVFWDMRWRRIPNWLVAPLALAGLYHAAWLGGTRSLLVSLLGIVVGVAVLYLQFTRGLMGAGDVKLLGALGAWTGVLGVLVVAVISAALGGVLSLVALARLDRAGRRDVGQNLYAGVLTRDISALHPSEISRRRGIPYGVALALGAAGFAAWRAFT